MRHPAPRHAMAAGMITMRTRALRLAFVVAMACLADAAPRVAEREDTVGPVELVTVVTWREMQQMRAELGSANGRVSRLEATVQEQGEMLAALFMAGNNDQKEAAGDIEARVREEVAAQCACEPAAQRRMQGDAVLVVGLGDSGVVHIFKRDVSLSHLSPNVDESNDLAGGWRGRGQGRLQQRGDFAADGRDRHRVL